MTDYEAVGRGTERRLTARTVLELLDRSRQECDAAIANASARAQAHPNRSDSRLLLAIAVNFQPQQLDVGSGNSLRHVFYDDVFFGIRVRAHSGDLDLLLLTELAARVANRPNHYSEICRQHGADGIILVAFEPHDAELTQLADSGLPCVAIDTHIMGRQASFVTSDNIGGAVAAVRHLHESGKKRIAFVGGVAGTVASSNRRLGYESGLEELGLESPEEFLIDTDWRPATAYEKALALLGLPEPPDAFFCVSDELALGAMLAIEKSGRKIPDDVAVVGFDDTDLAHIVTPSLTSVHQDRVGLGAAAVETLLSMLEAPNAPFPVSLLPVELIVRESSQARIAAPEAEKSGQPAGSDRDPRLSISDALAILSSGEKKPSPNRVAGVPAAGRHETGRATPGERRLIGVFLGATPVPGIPGSFIHDLLLDLRGQAHAREIDLLVLSSIGALRGYPHKRFIERAKQLGVQGLVVLSLPENEHGLVAPAIAGFPCVTVGIDLLGDRIAFVMSDNINGATQAVRHLAEARRTRIAFIGGPERARATIDRHLGYRGALERFGLAYREEYVANADWLPELAREETGRMLSLSEPPDAVFCCSDVMAIGAMAAIEEAGLRIPEDVAVVGFDDTEHASLVKPTLTTVRQDSRTVAEVAMEAILGLLDRPDETPPVASLPVELVVRESAPSVARDDRPV